MSENNTKKKKKPSKRKAQQKDPSQMGRPRVFENRIPELKALMRLKPTLEDTAAFFECGATTVSEAIKEEFGLTFREFREQNMVHTRLDLVRKAIRKSDQSDTMHIFCLKNLCGWRDRHPDDEKINVTVNLGDRIAKARERVKKGKG